MKTTIVGIDCATDPSKVGLALGEVEGDKAMLWEVATGQRGESMSETIDRWTRGIGAVLLALDAPLGWPALMARTLQIHQAGDPISVHPNELFRRHTDRFVHNTIGKHPMDVGADRIARTAHAALKLLSDLRKLTGFPIRMAWSPKIEQVLCAIEVYPAATLQELGIRSSGYKRRADRDTREEMTVELGNHIKLPPDLTTMIENADALDAAVCVLAGADFVRDRCIEPDDAGLARKEGWIWIRRPEPEPDDEDDVDPDDEGAEDEER